MVIYQLRDVFTPGGQPTVTYVQRPNLDLEQKLRNALAAGYSIVAVTGSTKSGKTVLCNEVLSGRQSVWIEGGQVTSTADFWLQLAHRLDLNAKKAKSNTRTKKGAAGVSATLKVGAFGNEATLGGNAGGDISDSAMSSSEAATHIMLEALEKMLNQSRALIIDDFHYMPPETQRDVIQSVKSYVFKGLNVIVVAVPHRAFDIITIQNEMQGRFKSIEIPHWKTSELRIIADKGSTALNIEFNVDCKSRLCEEAFGSPILMQNFCSELCLRNNVTTTQSETKSLRWVEHMDSIFSEIAQNFGFPNYQILAKGPQSRTDRIARMHKDGSTWDIYETVLLAVSRSGPKSRTQYDEIRSSIREVVAEGGVPQKHEVVRALAHMTTIAKKNIPGEPIIEWVAKEDTLYITDPFLMFYMKWARSKK